jgi:molybdopterin molybdotransferase
MSEKPKMQSLSEALSKMLKDIPDPTFVEWVSLDAAFERILAEDVISPLAIPTVNNSAMDGYAIRFADVSENNLFKIVGQSLAGHPFLAAAEEGSCIRVTTGALVPDDFDTVVMQEDVTILNQQEGQLICLQNRPKAGQHVRLCGSEIEHGQTVLKQGDRLGPLQLGLLATLGVANVAVYKQLRVGVLSSGDELKQPGEQLTLGELYDSNRVVIKAVLMRLGYQVVDYGWVADEPVKLRQLFDKASSEVDALITSGGVSVGDADHTRAVLESIGQMHFWQVAIKPGKPFAFGVLGNCLFFGLPGNPVSAVITLEQLVLAGLAKRAGQSKASFVASQHKVIPASAKQPFRKKMGRLDFQRISVNVTVDGVTAEPVGLDSSGMLTSLLNADGWTWLEQDRGNINTDDPIHIQLKSSWLI